MPKVSSTEHREKTESIKTTHDTDVKVLLQQSIELSQKIHEQNVVIKRRLGMMLIMGYVKITLILIPLLLAIFFLPPLLQEAFSQYETLLSGNSSLLENILPLITSDISPEQIQEALKMIQNTK